MKTQHIVLGILGIGGIAAAYLYYKKNPTMMRMVSMATGNNTKAITNDATVENANAPAYTIANDQVQVVKDAGTPAILTAAKTEASQALIPPATSTYQAPAEPKPVTPPAYVQAKAIINSASTGITNATPNCSYSPGQLLRASDGRVYQVDENCVRHWVTGDVFSKYKFNGALIKNISTQEMQAINVGNNLQGLSGYSMFN
jgi:hypothetical protein